jgi:hypothetical protein
MPRFLEFDESAATPEVASTMETSARRTGLIAAVMCSTNASHPSCGPRFVGA